MVVKKAQSSQFLKREVFRFEAMLNKHEVYLVRKAQAIFTSLVKAKEKGAVVARYEEGFFTVQFPSDSLRSGPVIDKDELPEIVDDYARLLKEKGVKGRSLRQAVKGVETVVYGGNPEATASSVVRLQKIVRPRR